VAITRITSEQVRRLAEDVRAKILSKEALIAETEGEIRIRIFRQGDGFKIKLITMT
jgi:hypothetical protein